MSAIAFQLFMAIIALVLGVGLIYWINRRKFNRRNTAGLEGFSSFEASVFIRFLERIGKWLAYALILIGVLLFWSYTRMKKDKEAKVYDMKIEKISKR